jgi:hypothetical protein
MHLYLFYIYLFYIYILCFYIMYIYQIDTLGMLQLGYNGLRVIFFITGNAQLFLCL